MRRCATIAAIVGLSLVASIEPAGADDHAWRHARASAYGDPSIWDGGYWADGRWQGYWGQRTAWGWHCDASPRPRHEPWERLRRDSMGVAHRTLPLGTWLEVRIPTPTGEYVTLWLPVIDRGPYPPGWADGNGWAFDIAEPVIWSLGWAHAGPPRYHEVTGPVFGLQRVQWRVLDQRARECPALVKEVAHG